MSDAEALLRWYLALSVIAIAFLPAVAWLGAGLGAARFALLRPLSLAAAAATVWWPAIAVGLPFERTVILSALVLCGVVGWVFWFRSGLSGLNWRSLLAFEGLWVISFAAYALFRTYNPNIAFTEKPMEIALLSSISRSTSVPAPDPWLAGLTINYYYFGYQSVATIVKLGAVPPPIAFNLALATLFASCATVAAGIGFALARLMNVRRWSAVAAALLAPVLLLLAGNLETAKRLMRDFHAAVHAGWWDGVGWQASRIIVDVGVHGSPDPRPTINEFPTFSFVLGDLHPHVLTYPLLACVLALAIGIASSDEGRTLPRLAVSGGLIGLLYASNSWDAPAGLLFIVGAVVVAQGLNWRHLIRPVAAIGAGAVAVALPFLLTFHAPIGADSAEVPGWLDRIPLVGKVSQTFGIVNWRPSGAGELLTVHGAWLAICVAWELAVLSRDRRTRVAVARHRDALLVLASVSVAAAIVWMPALVLIGWPLGVALWIAAGSRRLPDRVIAGLFAVGLLLLLTPEFIYIQDVFGDRMNTVFKLYFQAWLVLSVASAAALVRLWSQSKRAAQALAFAGVTLVLLVTLPYGPLSAWDWTNGFTDRQGLDGSAYLATESPDDAALIAWVRGHAARTDVIVEAPGCSYGVLDGIPLSRISAFTGVPTLIGWQGHEYQWRRGDPEGTSLLNSRVDVANALLSGEPAIVEHAHDPRFLVFATQERTDNPGCSLSVARDESVIASLERAGWVESFRSGDGRIFVRSGDPLAGLSSAEDGSSTVGRR